METGSLVTGTLVTGTGLIDPCKTQAPPEHFPIRLTVVVCAI